MPSFCTFFCVLALVLLTANAEKAAPAKAHGALAAHPPNRQHHDPTNKDVNAMSAPAVYQIVDGKLMMAGHAKNEEVGLLGGKSKEIKQVAVKQSPGELATLLAAHDHKGGVKDKKAADPWYKSTPKFVIAAGAACTTVLLAVLAIFIRRRNASGVPAVTAAPTDESIVAVGATNEHFGWSHGSML
jgi:hypothetical protein